MKGERRDCRLIDRGAETVRHGKSASQLTSSLFLSRKQVSGHGHLSAFLSCGVLLVPQTVLLTPILPFRQLAQPIQRCRQEGSIFLQPGGKHRCHGFCVDLVESLAPASRRRYQPHGTQPHQVLGNSRWNQVGEPLSELADGKYAVLSQQVEDSAPRGICQRPE